MKNLLTIIFLALLSLQGTAQNIGINTDGSTPDASAILDIKSDDKGLLIPRVQLDDTSTAAPITAPVEGLLIYNETGAEPKGFYYWNGTSWIKLNTGNATGAWENNGSNVYLVNSNDSVGIGTNTPQAKLDVVGTISAKEFKTSIITVGGINDLALPPNNPNFSNLADLSSSFTLSHSANIIISYQVAYQSVCTGYLVTRVLIDGIENVQMRSVLQNVPYGTCSGYQVVNLGTGLHTVDVQYRTSCQVNILPTSTNFQTRNLQIHILGDQ